MALLHRYPDDGTVERRQRMRFQALARQALEEPLVVGGGGVAARSALALEARGQVVNGERGAKTELVRSRLMDARTHLASVRRR